MADRGVLFDVDGTLVDTTFLHTVAWWEAFEQFGQRVEMVRIRAAIGMGSDRILDELLPPARDRGDDEAITNAHAALMAVHWPALRPTPGAADLLRACATRGLTVVLASSAAQRELKALRAAIDADDVIDVATSADDARSSKPAPDLVEVALRRSGLVPANAVYVGDSVWDVYATAKLAMPCIGLTCGGTTEAELRAAGAAAVFDSPRQLLSSLDTALGTLTRSEN